MFSVQNSIFMFRYVIEYAMRIKNNAYTHTAV